MTSPVWFRLGDNEVTTASQTSTTGIVSGVLAGIVAIALALAALFLYHRRRTLKQATGVAFENPSYLREVNMEHVQVTFDQYAFHPESSETQHTFPRADLRRNPIRIR